MNNLPPERITFKLRLSRRLDFGFGFLFCFFGFALFLCLSLWAFPVEELYSSLANFAFMVFMIVLPLAGSIFFGSSVIRTRITFCTEGVLFQAFLYSKYVPWNEIKGFLDSDGEIYFCIEDPNGRFKRIGFPLSWFSNIRLDNKNYKPDRVLNQLKTFAPNLFKGQSGEEGHLNPS
jgi:hypothetical protein